MEAEWTGASFLKSLRGLDSNAAATITLPPGFNSTSSNGSSSTEPKHMSMESLIFCVFGVIFMFWCLIPRGSGARASSRIRRARELRYARMQRMKDPKYREELLTNCLWVQKVLKIEGEQLTLGPPESSPPAHDHQGGNNGQDEDYDNSSLSGHESLESFSEETNTCAICLEPYVVGDVLAWSRTTTIDGSSNPQPSDAETGLQVDADSTLGGPLPLICNHVFHKDCIYSWLMHPKHDDCPACRAIIVRELPAVDGEQISVKPSSSEDSEDQPESFSNSVAFVVVHGLVSSVRRASYGLIATSVGLDDLDQDECDSPVVEMVTQIQANKHIIPRPSPIRRVASYGDKPSHTFLRRRSFGSTRSTEGGADFSMGLISNGPVPPPLPMRRTLSGGVIIKRSTLDGGGTVLVVKDQITKKAHPGNHSTGPATRPVWSAEAERALCEAFDARLNSSSMPRRFVPAEIHTLSNGGGFSKEIRVGNPPNTLTRPKSNVFRSSKTNSDNERKSALNNSLSSSERKLFSRYALLDSSGHSNSSAHSNHSDNNDVGDDTITTEIV